MNDPTGRTYTTTLRTSERGQALIRQFEGLSLKPYRCPAGKWTIGYGHTGQRAMEGKPITADEAKAILAADLRGFERWVAQMCPVAHQHEFDAMVSLAFNIGNSAFHRSSVRRWHNAGAHAEAARSFALWCKVKGQTVPGLVRRRAAETELYRGR